MSVGVALSALDGVVLFADGRTSHVVNGEALSDTTVKLVAAPYDLPFVVVPIGRASINGVDAANLVKRGLDNFPHDDLRIMDLKTVTERLASVLETKEAESPQEGVGERGEYTKTGFSVMVAGYGGTNSFEDAEIWTSTIPTRDLPPQRSAQPVTVCGPGTYFDTLIHDLFDSFNDDLDAGDLKDGQDTYKLRGLTMKQVRERAEGMLREAASNYPNDFCAAGVGGRWLLAQVGPDGPIRVDTADIGPMSDAMGADG